MSDVLSQRAACACDCASSVQVADAKFAEGITESYYMHGESYSKVGSLLPHPFWQMKVVQDAQKACCETGSQLVNLHLKDTCPVLA